MRILSINDKPYLPQIIKEEIEKNIWYHGTPDAREVVAQGGFSNRTKSVTYIENPDEWDSVQEELNNAKLQGNDKLYFELLDKAGAYQKQYKIKSPIFLTNKESVAKTYADPHRAFDYQKAEEKVLKVKTNPSMNVLKINAPNQRFRFINVDAVKKSFIDSGVPVEQYNKLFRMFNYVAGDKGIKTDTIAAMAQYMGFDAIDVMGTLDSYHGGTTPSTVRAVFDKENLSVIK